MSNQTISAIKKVGHIIGIVALSLFLLVYCLVALVNYSAVQSMLGSAAGSYLSKETGGTIKVGSLSANILGQAVLRDVLWMTPSNDTVAYMKKAQVKFDRFPFKEGTLTFDKVKLHNGYYHFDHNEEGTSMDFLLHYLVERFGKKEHDKHTRFTLNINRIEADNLAYRQTLPRPESVPDSVHGVDVCNMYFYDCDIKVRNLRVCNDHITCKLEKFNATEQSGFSVDQFKANVYVASNGISATNMTLDCDSTHIDGDVLLHYPSWETMRYYVDSVYMFAQLNSGTRLSGSTAGYWTEALWGVNDLYEVEGTVYGPVNDLYCQDMLLRFGYGSEMELDGHLQNITRFPEATLKADIYRLATNHSDLASLTMLQQFGVTLPNFTKQMGQLEAQAHVDGSMEALTAQASLNCALGQMDVTGWTLKDESDRDNYIYFANINSPKMQLSAVVPNEWISQTGCQLTVQGQGFDPHSMVASVEGRLFNTHLRGNRVNPIYLNAQLDEGAVDALITIRDTVLNMKCDAHMDLFGSESMGCVADIDLARADLYRLKLASDSDSIFNITTHLKGNLEWGSMDDIMESIQGNLALNNTSIERNYEGLKMDNMKVDLVQEDDEKRMNIRSDMLQARIDGNFSYAALPLIVRHFCDNYVPRYYNPFMGKEPVKNYDLLADADINLQIDINDPYRKLQFLLPSIHIANGTSITGNYNFAESLKMVVRSDSIRIGGVMLNDLGVNCRELGGQYVASVMLEKVSTGGQDLIDNVGLELSMDSRSLLCDIQWDNQADTLSSNADLSLIMRSDTNINTLTLLRNSITVYGSPWNLVASGPGIIDREGIMIDGLRLQSLARDQAIQIDAAIRHQDDDQVNVAFEHFDLNTLAFLWQHTPLNVEGVIDGSATLYGLTETPYLNAQLTVDDLDVNEVPLGDADIKSTWNAELNQLSLNLITLLHTEQGSRNPLYAEGYFDMSREVMGMDFDVRIDKLALQAGLPFADNVLSQLDGSLSGNLSVSGTIKEPALYGRAYIEEGVVGVDYLNTTFAIDDTIYIYPNAIRLKNLMIHDAQTGSLTLNGLLRHSYFQDMRLDFTVDADNFLCLNSKPHYDDFYGTLLIDADGRVSGPIENLRAELNATTRQGTELHMPITSKKDVEMASYIEFIDGSTPYYYIIPTAQGTETQNIEPQKALSPQPSTHNFNLTVNLTATPDAHIYLPIETSSVDVDLAATGTGDLLIRVASGIDPSITGVYEIGQGSLDMSILGLVSRKFAIAEGGTITFPGAINQMELNVEAIYLQRVNTATLTGESSIEGNGQNISVQSVISVSGTMNSPKVGFDIRLPNADASVQEEVFSYIDRTNEIDMLNQTLSLLVLNRFYNGTTNSSATTTDGIAGGYSVVANTLGSLVSEAVEFVDVGFDYKSATELTGQQIDLDISKQWNKFYFESTFGFGSDARAIDGNSNNNNTITGDVLLGYKVNPRLHFFVFNRSNTNDYTRSDLPFKQGVGMKYVRDFDSWKDLFKKKN